jgi:L-ascorbate metabolism protein UlaG (beta-lactamase superfamily)
VTNPGVAVEGLPHIDVVLISHNHFDHLDIPSLREIAGRQNSPPLILTGLGNKPLLEQHGLVNVSELDWGGTVQAGTATFHFLEAIHISRRRLLDKGRSLWGSFLI